MPVVSPQYLSHFLGTHLKVLLIFIQNVCGSFSYFVWVPLCLYLYKYFFYILEHNHYLFAIYLFVFYSKYSALPIGNHFKFTSLAYYCQCGSWCSEVWTHSYFLSLYHVPSSVYYLPYCHNWPYLQETPFPILENGIRKQYMVSEWARCFGVMFPSGSCIISHIKFPQIAISVWD